MVIPLEEKLHFSIQRAKKVSDKVPKYILASAQNALKLAKEMAKAWKACLTGGESPTKEELTAEAVTKWAQETTSLNSNLETMIKIASS